VSNRRAFITLIGAAASWPRVARAQNPERMRRVVFLHALAGNDPEVRTRVAAFRQGLETLGWVENRNVQVEHRFSGGDFAQMQAHVTELVSSPPDLIVVSGSPLVAALKYATRTIPIVFSLVVDPVGQGFVASLAATSPASPTLTSP
jgi:putative tryptophan/tyrosine transport system substrate-binding protein